MTSLSCDYLVSLKKGYQIRMPNNTSYND
jgi:hypothetical protein